MPHLRIKRPHVTSTLLRRLFKAPDLDTYVNDNADLLVPPKLCKYLAELCKACGELPGQIIQRADIDRTFGHQIFNGTRNPSRDKLIQLAFGFGLDAEGTQELLKIAQKNLLYPLIIRDAVILRCLNDQKSITQTQIILEQMGCTILGGVAKHV